MSKGFFSSSSTGPREGALRVHFASKALAMAARSRVKLSLFPDPFTADLASTYIYAMHPFLVISVLYIIL